LILADPPIFAPSVLSPRTIEPADATTTRSIHGVLVEQEVVELLARRKDLSRLKPTIGSTLERGEKEWFEAAFFSFRLYRTPAWTFILFIEKFRTKFSKDRDAIYNGIQAIAKKIGASSRGNGT
jgi:hypothetical protein